MWCAYRWYILNEWMSQDSLLVTSQFTGWIEHTTTCMILNFLLLNDFFFLIFVMSFNKKTLISYLVIFKILNQLIFILYFGILVRSFEKMFREDHVTFFLLCMWHFSCFVFDKWQGHFLAENLAFTLWTFSP